MHSEGERNVGSNPSGTPVATAIGSKKAVFRGVCCGNVGSKIVRIDRGNRDHFGSL